MMRIGKIRLAVLSCLLGALAAGGSGYWKPEEDAILVQFIRDGMEDTYLTMLDATDRINAWRRENGWAGERTKEGVYDRWHHHLQAEYPELIFQKTARSTRRVWSNAEKRDLQILVERNADKEGKIEWVTVREDMCRRGWRRSPSTCRNKWRNIVIGLDVLCAKPAAPKSSRKGRARRRTRLRLPAPPPAAEEVGTLRSRSVFPGLIPSLQELGLSPIEGVALVFPEPDLELIPSLQKFWPEGDELDGDRFGLNDDRVGLNGDGFGPDFDPDDFGL
jgi:hypothetical protein